MFDLVPYLYAVLGVAGVAAALWHTRRQVVYTGRHRAVGPSTLTAHDPAVKASECLLAGIPPLQEFPELADGRDDPAEFDSPAPTKGAYAHLRTAELDSTAERFFALVGRGLRPPSPWGTPMDDDEWTVPVGVEGHAIAGRTR